MSHLEPGATKPQACLRHSTVPWTTADLPKPSPEEGPESMTKAKAKALLIQDHSNFCYPNPRRPKHLSPSLFGQTLRPKPCREWKSTDSASRVREDPSCKDDETGCLA